MNRFRWSGFLLLAFAGTISALFGSEKGTGRQQADGSYEEPLRPQFHFTAPEGWLNDPNGLVYFKGEYHLFYQRNSGLHPINEKSWGHALSTDLVHWRNLPVALSPLPRPDGRLAGAWSGSGFVDWNNTAGFQTGSEKPLVLAWTAAGLGQCLAYSNDRGRTFTPYAGNPVIPPGSSEKANDPDRDPFVFWHAPTKKWVLVLSVSHQGAFCYSSPDLKHWTYHSTFPGLWECPNLFELPVDGQPGQTKWIIHDASGKYFIGHFDGRSFTQESGPFLLDHGRNYYAAQVWSDLPPADGRKINIGWMSGGKFPGMPFNQQMGVPSVLTLKTLPEGLRVTKLPVREIEMLRTAGRDWKDQALRPETNLLADIRGDTFDLVAELEPGAAQEIGFKIRGEAVRYEKDTLSCLGKSVPLKPMAGRIKLRILVDRTSLEIYGNDGAVSMTSAFLPPADNQDLELFARGGEARVVSLHVYKMRSAWRNHP
ncbi:MAG: glycoside hydrolase family 32 protein [Planctomycetes bacterium]|nr:glycoside hydrolase family 32 protein [Planctomycetota bacterium]